MTGNPYLSDLNRNNMSEIDWSKPIHYDGGEYPCMITLDHERFSYTDPKDTPINVIITTPKGRWLAPMVVSMELMGQADWMRHAYLMAVRHYERRTEPNSNALPQVPTE